MAAARGALSGGPAAHLPRAACAALLLLLTGCRDAAERRAAEVAGLRDRAADGIVALEEYCTARDSVLADSRNGDAGAELALEQTLYELDSIADYCEEFRSHSHDAHEDTASTAAPPAPVADSAAHAPSVGGRGG